MANQTVKTYKKTLSGSIGAGMGSLFAPGGRKYYILEHKVTSKYHRAGEAQQIIVDNIELGRDSHCQVRFDDRFPTVSRHHAAIVKDGDGWKLVQISKTNSTLLNGTPVQTEWYLQNGDEIQLSKNGPKLGFIIPTGKNSTVGSIGLTRRLSLFRQQALRPYKYAITALSCVLVIAIAGLGTWSYLLHDDLAEKSRILAEQIAQGDKSEAEIKELNKQLAEANEKITAAQKERTDLESKVKAQQSRINELSKDLAATTGFQSGELAATFKSTYYVQCYPMYNGDPIPMKENAKSLQDCYHWSGSGFLLSNGYFVTAQHMVHIDNFGTKPVYDKEGKVVGEAIDLSKLSTQLNVLYYSGELTIRVYCFSQNEDDNLIFEYSYYDMKYKLGSSTICRYSFQTEGGQTYNVATHGDYAGGDWAYYQTNRSGGLAYDAPYSMDLPVQTRLSIVGFPTKQGIATDGVINPLVTEAITSRQGLEDDGTIKTGNDNTDHGNSGGPVYAKKDGKPVVVGTLSGAIGGDDSMKGRVVPIGAMFK